MVPRRCVPSRGVVPSLIMVEAEYLNSTSSQDSLLTCVMRWRICSAHRVLVGRSKITLNVAHLPAPPRRLQSVARLGPVAQLVIDSFSQ